MKNRAGIFYLSLILAVFILFEGVQAQSRPAKPPIQKLNRIKPGASTENTLKPGFQGSSDPRLERIKESDIPNNSFYVKVQGYSFGGTRIITKINDEIAFDYIIPKKGERGYGWEYYKDITKWVKDGRNSITLTFEQKEPLILSTNHGYRFVIGERIRNNSRTVFSFQGDGNALKLLDKTAVFTGAFDNEVPENNLLGQDVYVFKVSSYASPTAQIDVSVNGRKVGSYIGHAQANISDFVIPGENKVEYTVRRIGESISIGKTIRDATIGIQKGNRYDTLVNYSAGIDELKQINLNDSRIMNYTFMASGGKTPSGDTATSKSNYPYYMETINYGPVQSTIWINDVNIGSFSSSGNAEISRHIVPGENRVKITVKKQGKISSANRMGVKIYRRESGRLNTVVNHEMGGGTQQDLLEMPEEKTFEYTFTD